MHKVTFAAFVLSVALLFTTCVKKSDSGEPKDGDAAGEKYETVEKDIREGKDMFIQHTENKLDSLNREIDHIRRRIDEKSGEAGEKLREQWKYLESKREKLRKDLEELKARTGENWRELKEGVDKQIENLEEGFDRLKKNLDE